MSTAITIVRSTPVRAAAILCVLLAASPFSRGGAEEVLVEIGETWKYFKGMAAPSVPATAWRDANFDDSAWLDGPSGIGYGDGDDATVLSDMEDLYTSVFCRKTFNIVDPAAIQSLTFWMDWDDGFAAYLNGVEIARSQLGAVGEEFSFDRLATASHERLGSPASFDVTAALASLQAGENVLAVQVHNTTLSSSDLTCIPRLVADDLTPLCPSGLVCSRGGGGVRLSWTNGRDYDEIRITRNGLEIAGSPFTGGIETVLDGTANPGVDNGYELTAIFDDKICPTLSCRLACSGQLSCSLELVDGLTQASLSWESIPNLASAEVIREGATLATLTQGETSYVDGNVESDQAEDDTDYDVILTDTEGSTCQLSCGPLSLCPLADIDLVDVDGAKRIRLTWTNRVKLWTNFVLSRDGIVIANDLDPDDDSYVDESLDPASETTYTYTLSPQPPVGVANVNCDRSFTFTTPDFDASRYLEPDGGWDYELELGSLAALAYNPTPGEEGNLDGEWIRELAIDGWDGSAPLDIGAAPGGAAPGGIGLVDVLAASLCGENGRALQILDPGNPENPAGSLAGTHPDAYDGPANATIFLGVDLGETGESLLSSGLTFHVRMRISPNAPAYMNAGANGDGEPLTGGRGLVGVYFQNDGSLAGAGPSVGLSFALNSSNGGQIQMSSNPVRTRNNAGIKNFQSFWITVEDVDGNGAYRVQVYQDGELLPEATFSGDDVALQQTDVDFGQPVGNYLAIGFASDSNDGIAEIMELAVKRGVHEPRELRCDEDPGGGEELFLRGDDDASGVVDLSDPVFNLAFQFLSGTRPPCMDAADTDDSGLIDLSDPVYNLVYQFASGPRPPSPGPFVCGKDLTADAFPACVYPCP